MLWSWCPSFLALCCSSLREAVAEREVNETRHTQLCRDIVSQRGVSEPCALVGGFCSVDFQVFQLIEADVVAYFQYRCEPTIEEDLQAETGVEGQLGFEGEIPVIGVNHGDWARAEDTDAAHDVGVVMEDEVTEPGELTVRRNVGEVEVRAVLVLSEWYGDTRRPPHLGVELFVDVEGFVVVPVQANREHF